MTTHVNDKPIDFLHFGETCNPIVIINFILKIKKKTMFSLAVYPFNTIVQILEDNTFGDIADLQYIRFNSNKVDYLEVDTLNGYCHNNEVFTNTKYPNIQLLHDYGLEPNTNTIINYNFIKKSFDTKIRNLNDSLRSKNFLCFVCFLYMSNILDLELEN